MVGHASTSLLESWAMSKPAIEYDIFSDGIGRITDLEGKNTEEVINIVKKCLLMNQIQITKLKSAVTKRYLFESENAAGDIVNFLIK
jgi:hypothetical protein